MHRTAASQTILAGGYEPASTLAASVDKAVTAAAMQAVLRRMLASAPSMAVYGDAASVPDVEELA